MSELSRMFRWSWTSEGVWMSGKISCSSKQDHFNSSGCFKEPELFIRTIFQSGPIVHEEISLSISYHLRNLSFPTHAFCLTRSHQFSELFHISKWPLASAQNSFCLERRERSTLRSFHLLNEPSAWDYAERQLIERVLQLTIASRQSSIVRSTNLQPPRQSIWEPLSNPASFNCILTDWGLYFHCLDFAKYRQRNPELPGCMQAIKSFSNFASNQLRLTEHSEET